MIDAVWRAVGGLNPDLKMALLLRDVVGLSYAEIADSLEITLATVKWRIYKAREEVQLALAREGIGLRSERSRPRQEPSQRLRSSSRDAQNGRGSPASRISRCVLSIAYGSRRNAARRAARSSRSQAARGSPSRGWPTDPGFRSQLAPSSRSIIGSLGCEAAVELAVEPDRERDVAVADEDDAPRRQLERRERGLVGRARTPRSGRAGCRGRGRPRRPIEYGLSASR